MATTQGASKVNDTTRYGVRWPDGLVQSDPRATEKYARTLLNANPTEGGVLVVDHGDGWTTAH